MEASIFIIALGYLIASVLFILGIKLLSKPASARRGNLFSALGMLLAVGVTLLDRSILSWSEIAFTMLAGALVGLVAARRVAMTQMPEMVALFNGFGGAASMFVATAEQWKTSIAAQQIPTLVTMITVIISIVVGAITTTGSLVAYGKLSGRLSGQAVVFRGQHLLNLLLALLMLAAAVWMLSVPTRPLPLLLVLLLALLLGVLTVVPIGGADMPVVVSLLNSYSGVAACATGFVLSNQVLIIAGALVGASGLILTQIMCKAMNRSLLNVLLGGFGQSTAGGRSGSGSDIVVKEVRPEEAALLFDAASSVIIVPGYGMAVAQAQHVVRELMELLEKRGIEVRFAIHPVAGRMPGHMNVLLAEANVPYDKLVEMEQINDAFANTDVVLIIGANDVVNPAALNDKNSPIFGMPILHAHEAKTVIVCKRSMNPGYAGIENELFGYPNTLMLFGDAKKTITEVVNELKEG